MSTINVKVFAVFQCWLIFNITINLTLTYRTFTINDNLVKHFLKHPFPSRRSRSFLLFTNCVVKKFSTTKLYLLAN